LSEKHIEPPTGLELIDGEFDLTDADPCSLGDRQLTRIAPAGLPIVEVEEQHVGDP
jgi:hypothetical protein